MKLETQIDTTQEIINTIVEGKANFEELVRYLANSGALVRVNAVMQIPKQFSSADAVAVLEAAAQDPKNGIVLLGRTIKAIAVGSLLAMKRKDATDVAGRIIETLSGNEIQDLEFHLRSEGLQMPRATREAKHGSFK